MLTLGIEPVFLKKRKLLRKMSCPTPSLPPCPNSGTKLNLSVHCVTQRHFLEERVQGEWMCMPKTNQLQTAFRQLSFVDWYELTH